MRSSTHLPEPMPYQHVLRNVTIFSRQNGTAWADGYGSRDEPVLMHEEGPMFNNEFNAIVHLYIHMTSHSVSKLTIY